MAAKNVRTFDRIVDSMAILAALIVLFVMVAVGVEVIMRSFFDRVTRWVLEISEYSLLFVTFLGAAWVLRRERHVRMDIVLNLFSPKSQSLINFFTAILCTIVCLIITWFGGRVTWDYFRSGYYFSTPLETPQYLILVIIPIGALLLLVQFLRNVRGYLNAWRNLKHKPNL